ncbi:MAG: hypothetical protein PHP55_01795, partial [Methanoculleus sp.]|nr:hypothetical protein [Methanoculleus sp.]
MTEINNIKVTIEERNLIINNGADKLPLNPTSQGFSGQSVRKQLSQAVTGARGSVLALMIEKFAIIEDFSNTVLLVEVRLVGDDLTFIYADGREFKFSLDVITGGLEQEISATNGRIDELQDDIDSRTENNDFVAYQQLVQDFLNDKVDKTQTIMGLDFQDNITRTEVVNAIGEATENLSGLMSIADKQKLDANIYTKPEIDAKLSSTYKPKGTITGTELLAITPSSENEGFVYNISTEFTTTIDFIEGAGITHIAGENVVIVENTEGVYKFDVLSGFVDLSNYVEKDDNEILTTEDITINTDVGGLPSGTTINTGTSITELIRLLGRKTYYPTFISPTLSLAINVANSVEAGYTSNATLTATFNKGEIKGDLVEGVWNANTKQNDRAGDIDTYEINGVDNGGVNTKTLTDNVIEEGANVYNAKVYFTTGSQPLDSDGNNYETPLAAGNISTSKTIYGYRKLFYGLSSQATNSAEVRALSNSLLNPANGTTFTINITSGASKVVFAY